MNLNQLGEAILGEDEAEKRIQAILDRIKDPECVYFSVKISVHFQPNPSRRLRGECRGNQNSPTQTL